MIDKTLIDVLAELAAYCGNVNGKALLETPERFRDKLMEISGARFKAEAKIISDFMVTEDAMTIKTSESIDRKIILDMAERFHKETLYEKDKCDIAAAAYAWIEGKIDRKAFEAVFAEEKVEEKSIKELKKAYISKPPDNKKPETQIAYKKHNNMFNIIAFCAIGASIGAGLGQLLCLWFVLEIRNPVSLFYGFLTGGSIILGFVLGTLLGDKISPKNENVSLMIGVIFGLIGALFSAIFWAYLDELVSTSSSWIWYLIGACIGGMIVGVVGYIKRR